MALRSGCDASWSDPCRRSLLTVHCGVKHGSQIVPDAEILMTMSETYSWPLDGFPLRPRCLVKWSLPPLSLGRPLRCKTRLTDHAICRDLDDDERDLLLTVRWLSAPAAMPREVILAAALSWPAIALICWFIMDLYQFADLSTFWSFHLFHCLLLEAEIATADFSKQIKKYM